LQGRIILKEKRRRRKKKKRRKKNASRNERKSHAIIDPTPAFLVATMKKKRYIN